MSHERFTLAACSHKCAHKLSPSLSHSHSHKPSLVFIHKRTQRPYPRRVLAHLHRGTCIRDAGVHACDAHASIRVCYSPNRPYHYSFTLRPLKRKVMLLSRPQLTPAVAVCAAVRHIAWHSCRKNHLCSQRHILKQVCGPRPFLEAPAHIFCWNTNCGCLCSDLDMRKALECAELES